MLKEELKDTDKNDLLELNTKPSLPSVQFFIDEFLKLSKEVFRVTSSTSSGSNAGDAVEKCGVFVTQCLATASSIKRFRTVIQERSDVIKDSLGILYTLHQIDKNIRRKEMTLEQISIENLDGFKNDLVQLVGNLSYRHRASQDIVREVDGIPLLLDCCNPDLKNPFLTQWIIVAIRNLCENNNENQSVIYQLKDQGAVDLSLVEQFKFLSVGN